MTAPFDTATFRDRLRAAARTAFAEGLASHPGERFYAFAIYTAPNGEYFFPTFNTEEALERSAGENGYDPADIRWNACDWEYHLEGQDHFEPVNRLIDEYRERTDWETYADQNDEVFAAALEVLQELDREGLFGPARERGEVVLAMLLGDLDEDLVLEWAAEINPPALVERLESELDAADGPCPDDDPRSALFDDHLHGFTLDETSPDEVVADWGEPTRRLDSEETTQLLYQDGRQSPLGTWSLVAFTFLDGELRAISYYEPSEAILRDSPVLGELGEPDDQVDALAMGWGKAEGGARCEAFPFPLEDDLHGVIVTGTDRQGHLQYLVVTSFAVEEPAREEAACPACGWHPPFEPLWQCDGCGCEFDTFETRARCPECGKTWETTLCLSCGVSTAHASWWEAVEDEE